eukprot:470650-Rhodomonas_salina.2
MRYSELATHCPQRQYWASRRKQMQGPALSVQFVPERQLFRGAAKRTWKVTVTFGGAAAAAAAAEAA